MWIYKDKELKDEQIPKNAIGFVYLITNLKNNKRYIGRKLLTMAGYKQVKGVRKSIRKESDWKDYYSSSPELLYDVEKTGKEHFKREILLFCETKTILNYYEEKFQYGLGVLESPNWYNSNIRAKIFKKNIHHRVKSDYQECLNKCLTPLNPLIKL